ncbi:hypothetical protein KQH54_01815 [bacterium]|nr:hypothetical protein [bacterium]
MAYSPIDLNSYKKGWSYTIANLVSNVLNPPVVSMLGIFLMASVLGTANAWRWAILFVLLAVITPSLYVYWLLKKGRIENFHIPNRENRTRPYMVIIGTNLLIVLLMVILKAPFLLLAFAIMGVLQSTLLFLINNHWKISGHATAITGLSTFMVASLGWSMSPVLVMVPLVAWARIRTRSHSFWQTVAGVITGASFILLTWVFLSKTLRPEY